MKYSKSINNSKSWAFISITDWKGNTSALLKCDCVHNFNFQSTSNGLRSFFPPLTNLGPAIKGVNE